MSESFTSRPYVETSGERVRSLVYRLERLKETLGEVEADIEKCQKKEWLDYKTIKRLDKAVTVMKVGYKIAKRAMNRDVRSNGSTSEDDPPLSETDRKNAIEAIRSTPADEGEGR